MAHKRTPWLVLFCCLSIVATILAQNSAAQSRLPQDPGRADEDEINRLIDQAKVRTVMPIMFGGGPGVFGAGEFRHQQQAQQAAMTLARFSDKQYQQHLAPAIKKLIEIGEPALLQIHEKIKNSEVNAPLLANLVEALRFIGNHDSIEILIDRYQKADEAFKLMDAPGIKPEGERFAIHDLQQKCLLAIWSLTGRRHVMKPDEWKAWWEKTKPYYVARKKNKSTFDPKLFERAFKELTSSPDKAPATMAREQIVILGRSVLPELHKLLESAGNQKDLAYNLAWCIDELRDVNSLTSRQRVDYFINRFSKSHKFQLPPIENEARLRAIFHGSLAEFSSIAIAVDGKGVDRINSIMAHFHVNFAPFRLKYLAYKRDNYGVIPSQFAEQFRKYGYVGGLSEDKVKQEIDETVPILVDAINSNNANASYAAARMADYIGMVSPYAPERLVQSLRDQWLKNGKNSATYGSAMVRFNSPTVTEALRKGLFSGQESIVRTSANYVNKGRFPPDKFPEVYQKLVELVQHKSESMRFATVRTLRNTKPELLKPFLHDLSKDPNDNVVVEVCYAIDKMKNPMFAEVLVAIAMDESRKEHVRTAAIDRLGEKHFDSSVDEIKPLLKDKKLHGYALSAFYEAKGKASLPILMDYIKKHPGDASIATQYLPRLTGLKFRTETEWLDWWSKQLQ